MKQDYTHSLSEKLFSLMILGDDRAIAATAVTGEVRYRRADSQAATTPTSLSPTQGA
jgi:guanine deaminase